MKGKRETNQSETGDTVSSAVAVGGAQELWRVQIRFSHELAMARRLAVFRGAGRGTAVGRCCGVEQHAAVVVEVLLQECCCCCWLCCHSRYCRF